jgi:cbb3-type cytochrome oxidase cytochrome c subunit
LQLGRAAQEKTVPAGDNYPVARPGLAKRGAEVYRSLGCVYCHSQQVGQDHTTCELVLTDAGTNPTPVMRVIAEINSALAGKNAKELLTGLPKTLTELPRTDVADPMIKDLAKFGAKAEVRVEQHGPDISRGWGRRATVAADYLYDNPVQLGTRRLGPDLANVGLRWPDVNWHLLHLYEPKSKVAGSTMPPYRFLFETRKIIGHRSPDALDLPADLLPPGSEIVPTENARALAAYLVSLRADAPLFEAPFTPPPVAAPATNAPAK